MKNGFCTAGYEEFMKNWLEIAVGIYLLCMVLYGHYKGFVRMAVSTAALAAALLFSHMAMPYAAEYLKEETSVYTWISDSVSEGLLGDSLENDAVGPDTPGDQQALIESLGLPKELQELLVKNNNSSAYYDLGVERFADYISSWLANAVVRLAGYVILFIIAFTLIHILMKWLDLMAKLPILHGMNQLAGAVLGAVQGLLFLWVLSLLVTACSGMGWAASVITQINQSWWLSVLYHYNILSKVLLGIIQGIVV